MSAFCDLRGSDPLKADFGGDFPGSPMVKNLLCNAGDTGSTSGWGTKTPCAVGLWSPSTSRKDTTRHKEALMRHN